MKQKDEQKTGESPFNAGIRRLYLLTVETAVLGLFLDFLVFGILILGIFSIVISQMLYVSGEIFKLDQFLRDLIQILYKFCIRIGKM